MADRTLSHDSGIAPYETFFHDFELEAFPFFNYWTKDETTNDRLVQGTQNINSMPRFVKLAWNIAPDLVADKIAADKLNPPNLNRKSTSPVPTDQFIVDGVKFTPDQLRPKVFTQLVNAIANSDISPGVIQSVVSLDFQTANLAPRLSSYLIDIDSWFVSPASDGVPLNYLQSALSNRTNGYVNLPSFLNGPVSPANVDAHYEMFAGNYSVQPASFIDSQTSIRATNATYSPISTRTMTAQSSRPLPAAAPTPLQTMYNQVGSSPPQPSPSHEVKVAFVDVGVGSVVSPERVNAVTDASHANSILALSQVLGSLIAYSESGLQNVDRKVTVKSFDAPSGLPIREYVGYIIEKYEQVNGVFKLKEVIGISDPSVDEYYDTKIRYGGVYRYRIRSILRWVRPKTQGVLGTNQTISDPLALNNLSTSTTTLTPNFASYFGSEWSKNWAGACVIDTQNPDPPDQLQVYPDSRRKRVTVCFEIPDNSQKDIMQMTLYRRLVDSNGHDLYPWKRVADFAMDRPGYYIDTDVEFTPVIPAPDQLGFSPVAPYFYVYGTTATSVHNGESVLSEQLATRLNQNYDGRGEFPVVFYSSKGVDLGRDTGIFSTIPIKKYKTHIVVCPLNATTTRAPAEINLLGQERWGSRVLNGQSYIVRFHSLDTGETVDVRFNTDVTQLPPMIMQAPTNIYVPSANESYFYDSQALVSR